MLPKKEESTRTTPYKKLSLVESLLYDSLRELKEPLEKGIQEELLGEETNPQRELLSYDQLKEKFPVGRILRKVIQLLAGLLLMKLLEFHLQTITDKHGACQKKGPKLEAITPEKGSGLDFKECHTHARELKDYSTVEFVPPLGSPRQRLSAAGRESPREREQVQLRDGASVSEKTFSLAPERHS